MFKERSTSKKDKSKLSELTLLNLLGLIELAELSISLKLHKEEGIDQAIVQIDDALQAIAKIGLFYGLH